jgi:uncharacterized repeat protein (TIGR03806 family)
MVSVFAADKRLGAAVLGVLVSALACSSETHPNAAADASTGPHPGKTDAGDGGSVVTPAPEGEPYDGLEAWHLFTDAVKQVPSPELIPYDVNSPLFSDYASKRRFIYVPKGLKIGYSPTEKWKFPVGAILVKTFSYLADTRDPSKGERLLETRLLVRESGGWAPHTYVWNEAQTEAKLTASGTVIDSQFIDASGNVVTNGFTVPSNSDCRTCHGKLGVTDTLGGRTRQLNRDHDYGNGPENQVDHLAKLGLFDTAPEATSERQQLVDPFGTAPVFERVRSYFDSNCSQCHQPGSSLGSASGLWLDYPSTAPDQPRANWGFCKMPASAGGATCGRQFDVVPGKPDDSIVTCRVESTIGKVKMPPVGRNLVHTEAVTLLREWITGMDGQCGAGGAKPPSDAGAELVDSGGARDH